MFCKDCLYRWTVKRNHTVVDIVFNLKLNIPICILNLLILINEYLISNIDILILELLIFIITIWISFISAFLTLTSSSWLLSCYLLVPSFVFWVTWIWPVSIITLLLHWQDKRVLWYIQKVEVVLHFRDLVLRLLSCCIQDHSYPFLEFYNIRFNLGVNCLQVRFLQLKLRENDLINSFDVWYRA